MQTRARVRDVQAGRVLLECEAVATACGACAGRHGCALRWLARPGSAGLEVVGPAPEARALHPGDGVILEVDDGELLRAAALAYVPPLAGLLVVPLLVAPLLPGSEPAVLGGAVLGLAAGWGAARALLRRSPPRYRLRNPEGA